MNLHYKIIIKGKVQGVFYRASAKQQAELLNITGFAKNQPDGSVLIEAEGDEVSLQEFISWCKTGPGHAQVSDVETTSGQVMGYTKFEIRR